MNITYCEQDKLLMAQIAEEIDHYTANKIRNRIDFEIEKCIPKKLYLDFKNVKFMDSAGIGLIIGRYKTMSMFGGSTYLINVSNSVKKILEMSGITKIIPIVNKTGGIKDGKSI